MGDGSFVGDRQSSVVDRSTHHETKAGSASSTEYAVDLRATQEQRHQQLLERSRDSVQSIAGLTLPELMTRLQKFNKILSELAWSERGWRTYYKEQIREMERHVTRRLEDRLRHQIPSRDTQTQPTIDLASLQEGEQELAALAEAEQLQQKRIPVWKFWLWPERAQLALNAEGHLREQDALQTNIDALQSIAQGK